jgi:hypothetical protein
MDSDKLENTRSRTNASKIDMSALQGFNFDMDLADVPKRLNFSLNPISRANSTSRLHRKHSPHSTSRLNRKHSPHSSNQAPFTPGPSKIIEHPWSGKKKALAQRHERRDPGEGDLVWKQQ